jgi:6-phosphogluconolactonase
MTQQNPTGPDRRGQRLTGQRDIVVHANAEVLAAAAAARLVTRLVDVQAAGRVPRLVLTGGGIGTAVLEQLRAGPARDAVDWGYVDFYWGDERFLPPGDPERNETQAREALLDHLPVDPQRVHPMGADTGTGQSGAEPAAQAYAELLAANARPEDHGPVPAFDVTLLGMGAEGHTASVFPHSPAVYETERTVVAVHGCPKPPPTRVSLTLPAIRRSVEVWILSTGDAKAAAVAMALGGAGEVAIPVSGATGTQRTLWLLDRAAAAKLPRDLAPPIA